MHLLRELLAHKAAVDAVSGKVRHGLLTGVLVVVSLARRALLL
jgi:hypothetical protein